MEEKLNFITEPHSLHLITTGKRLPTDVKRILQHTFHTLLHHLCTLQCLKFVSKLYSAAQQLNAVLQYKEFDIHICRQFIHTKMLQIKHQMTTSEKHVKNVRHYALNSSPYEDLS